MHIFTIIFCVYLFQAQYFVFASQQADYDLINLQVKVSRVCSFGSSNECEQWKNQLRRYIKQNGYSRRTQVIRRWDRQLRVRWEWSCGINDRIAFYFHLKRNIQLKDEIDRVLTSRGQYTQRKLKTFYPYELSNNYNHMILSNTPALELETSESRDFTIGSSTSSGNSKSNTNANEHGNSSGIGIQGQAGFTIFGFSLGGGASSSSSDSLSNSQSDTSSNTFDSSQSSSSTTGQRRAKTLSIPSVQLELSPHTRVIVTNSVYAAKMIMKYDVFYEINSDLMAEALDFRFSNGAMCTLTIGGGQSYPVRQFLRLRRTLPDHGGQYLKFEHNKYMTSLEGKETISTDIYSTNIGKPIRLRM